MTKKVYLQPAMTVTDIDLNEQILANSVQTNGLDDDDLEQEENPGDPWDDAMSRRRNVWGDDEEEDW